MLNVVQFSGGKDSTAMLLMMLEKNMPIDDIIFCDTGKEFPQIYEHIEKVNKYIGGYNCPSCRENLRLLYVRPCKN